MEISNGDSTESPFWGSLFLVKWNPSFFDRQLLHVRQIRRRRDRTEEIRMHNTTMTEDIYLNKLIIRRESVWCFLASGVRLQGIIRSHHEEAIFLEPSRNSGGELMMIFK